MAADKVLKKTGTKSLRAYIGSRQATVKEWVTFSPILEVYDKETCYKGGGRLRDPLWRQTATRKHLRAMLKYILVVARKRR